MIMFFVHATGPKNASITPANSVIPAKVAGSRQFGFPNSSP